MDGHEDTIPTPEMTQVRSLLCLSPESSTEEVLKHIETLQEQNGQMVQVWETLTELLYLSVDTPPGDVLTTIALYIREAQFLREQEQRHMFIIQKLQNDKREILKRFHMNKPKVVTMSKIREKARFPGKAKVADTDDLGIIDDEQESLTESYDERQRQLNRQMLPTTENKSINGGLMKALDTTSYNKHNGETHLEGKNRIQGKPTHDDDRESKPQVQGFIMAKAVPKTFKAAQDFRNNVTHGTRESNKLTTGSSKQPQPDKAKSDSQQNITKPKSTTKSNYHSKMEKLRSSKKGYAICSEIHVAERGGCYDVPDLGLTLSIPGGALPEGSTSEKLVVGLSWLDSNSDVQPIGPIISIKPSGLPFRKPLAICLHHKSNITQLENDNESTKVQSTNLVLLQDVGGKGAESWRPVEPDTHEPFFTPLGFTAADNMVMFLKNAGKYSLIPSHKSTNYIPSLLRVLVFACYVHGDTGGMIKLNLYCVEDSKATQKLCELMVDSLKQEIPPQQLVTSHQMALSGSEISAQLDDIMEGWSIDGHKSQKTQLGIQCQGHKPAMTFTLMDKTSFLRCLLAKLTLTQHKPINKCQRTSSSEQLEDSVALCIDLDQMENSTDEPLSNSLLTSSFVSRTSIESAAKPPPVFVPQKSGTFITDYFEDTTGTKYSKELQPNPNTKVSRSPVLRLKVPAVKNEHSWIPEWVKSDLITEIKSEMTSVEKWDKLLAGLNMAFLDEILHQSVDPVLDLISYAEVTGVSVSKVKNMLGETGFEDSANILTKYLTRNEKTKTL